MQADIDILVTIIISIIIIIIISLLCLCLFQAVLCVIAPCTAEAARSVNHRTGSVRVGVNCVCFYFRLYCV